MIPTHELPLAKVDRDAIGMIVDEYLAKHQEFESSRARYGMDHYAKNPYPINPQGLKDDLIAYCARIRLGEVPVNGHSS